MVMVVVVWIHHRFLVPYPADFRDCFHDTSKGPQDYSDAVKFQQSLGFVQRYEWLNDAIRLDVEVSSLERICGIWNDCHSIVRDTNKIALSVLAKRISENVIPTACKERRAADVSRVPNSIVVLDIPDWDRMSLCHGWIRSSGADETNWERHYENRLIQWSL